MRLLFCATILLLGAALPACAFTTIDQYPCPDGGTQLTYENFGNAFMGTYCQSCHGSASTNRYGAPGDFIFDTREEIQRHRDRIFVRAAAGNTSMPPGPVDPPLELRNKLAEWLACGAP
jgi:uncharacterized membrane protein